MTIDKSRTQSLYARIELKKFHSVPNLTYNYKNNDSPHNDKYKYTEFQDIETVIYR